MIFNKNVFLLFFIWWFAITIVEVNGFNHVQTEKGKATGQSLIMSFAGILTCFSFMFYLMVKDNTDVPGSHSRLLSFIFVICIIIYILLWFFSGLWLNDDSKWDSWSNMNTWAQVHTILVVVMLLFLFLSMAISRIKKTYD